MTGYTETGAGNKSSVRLIFIIGSIWNMAMTTYLLMFTYSGAPISLAFYSGVQAVLIGLKLGQKPMEKQDLDSSINENKPVG